MQAAEVSREDEGPISYETLGELQALSEPQFLPVWQGEYHPAPRVPPKSQDMTDTHTRSVQGRRPHKRTTPGSHLCGHTLAGTPVSSRNRWGKLGLASQEQGREAWPGKSHLQQLISPGMGSSLRQAGQGSRRCHCHRPCQCHY